ncbi:MAG: hypothetical protein AAF467_10675 [Actinomycetota bacterium]
MQFTIDCRHCPEDRGSNPRRSPGAQANGVGCQQCVLTVAADGGRGASAVVEPAELAAVRRLQRAGLFGSLEPVGRTAA